VAELSAFLVVFVTVAGVECLDRTNFALLSYAAKEPPLPAWAGAALAFAATTLLAVAIGGLLVVALGPELVYVRVGGGLLLLAYAGYLALHPPGEERVREHRSVLATAFAMIFLLELGDTTMLLTINFVAAIPDPLLVGVAALAGLWCVAASACLLGPRLGARVEPKLLHRVVLAVLTIVGITTIVYAVDPGLLSGLAA
jgi:Ca2+/H+ antiporter, TMEM165/GDT1 family